MEYKVSKYINEIKKVSKPLTENVWDDVMGKEFWIFFETYGDAKIYLIERAHQRIRTLENEIKKLKKSIPKLESLTENK